MDVPCIIVSDMFRSNTCPWLKVISELAGDVTVAVVISELAGDVTVAVVGGWGPPGGASAPGISLVPNVMAFAAVSNSLSLARGDIPGSSLLSGSS